MSDLPLYNMFVGGEYVSSGKTFEVELHPHAPLRGLGNGYLSPFGP